MATYNLVNSVKGGCGKTTFSVMLTYYLGEFGEEEKEKKEEEKQKEQVLLIDADLLGTSMQVLFYGNADGSGEKGLYTNDVVDGVKERSENFIRKVALENGRVLNIIFSSMKAEDRDKFRSGRYAGYAPVVKHSIFRTGMRELISHSKRTEDGEVKHFIFDMPPNSDGFADTMMECVFTKKHSDVGTEDKRNLFIMVGPDWGHTEATIPELRNVLARNDELMPDRMFIVFNNASAATEIGSEGYKARKDKIEDELNKVNQSQTLLDRIFFLQMSASSEYARVGIEGDMGGMGLKNVESSKLKSVFPASVISAYARFGEDKFVDLIEEADIKEPVSRKNKLRELILGMDSKRGEN